MTTKQKLIIILAVIYSFGGIAAFGKYYNENYGKKCESVACDYQGGYEASLGGVIAAVFNPFYWSTVYFEGENDNQTN